MLGKLENNAIGRSTDISTKRTKIGEGIYLLYFAVMIGARAAGLYEGMMVYNITLVIGMLLFGCKMIVTKHTIKEYAVAAFFLLIAGIVYLHTGEKGLLVCFTMMLGMKGVSVNKVVKTGFIVAGVIILFKIFTGVFGILPEIYYTQEREGIGMTFRHSLGYAHPNTLHMNVLMLTMLGMYLVTKNLGEDLYCKEPGGALTENDKKHEALLKLVLFSAVALLFNFYIFQFSFSRTGLLTCLVFLFVNMWFFIVKKPRLLEKAICYVSFPAVCFMAIVLPFVVPEKIYDFIDRKLFTTRLSIAKYFWSNNSVSLFGIRLVNPEEWFKGYGLDMAQLYLFLQLGIVAFVVMSALTMWFIYYSLKKGNMQELAVLMGMLCLGIWEPLLYNLGFKNFVYVFMGAALYLFMAERFGEEKAVQTSEADGSSLKENMTWSDRVLGTVQITQIKISTIMKALACGILAGVCAMMIFVFATNAPSNYYGSRELGENGYSLYMEPVYFSPVQIEQMEASGDIIVGYVDEVTPMYEFGSEIAASEYRKRALTVAVFTCILASLAFICYNKR